MNHPQLDERQAAAHPAVAAAWSFVRYYVRHYHRLRLLNPCPIPPAGPGILICNHISGLDPILLQAVVPRPIVWLVAGEYYQRPWLKWLLDLVHAVPVARTGQDLVAMRDALRSLHRGRLLGIFPEGRISPSLRLLPFQTGVALLALRTGAAVYPAALEGSMRLTPMLPAFLNTHTATLAFGRPLSLHIPSPTREQLAHATLTFQDAILKLLQCPGPADIPLTPHD